MRENKLEKMPQGRQSKDGVTIHQCNLINLLSILIKRNQIAMNKQNKDY
jgi:hypothetical protein